VIEKLFKKHKQWIAIVKSFGEVNYAEDVVMEAYIKVNGREVNDSYFYLTLRSLTMDLHRKKVDMVEISESLNLVDEDYQEQDIEPLKEFITTFEWYDRDLFMLYANAGMSMRKLSRETKISFTSIYNTINKCKLKLKKEHQKNNPLD
jgi:DNA-directed RNA polymerase specialized sigma24 family protein